MSGITIIDAPPTFITPDEHIERTAATPTSFADIPPVLRHKEENVRIVLDPCPEGLTENELQKGTVYILESVLAFISASSGRGFQLEYPCIILHAISRGETDQHVYCQLGEPAIADQDEVEDEEEATELRELKIIPESTASLKDLFEALSYCASLHPDPDSSDDEMGMFGDEAFVDADVEAVQALASENVDGELELSETGRANLDRFDTLIEDPHGHLNGTTMLNGSHPPTSGGTDEGGERITESSS